MLGASRGSLTQKGASIKGNDMGAEAASDTDGEVTSRNGPRHH